LFKNVKHVFNNVIIMDLESVSCFTTKESSPGRVIKLVQCKQNSILTPIQTLIHCNYTNCQQRKESNSYTCMWKKVFVWKL
jgi:hypothetical protein